MEAVIIIDVLRRAGINVVSAGLKPGSVKGSRGTVLLPDTHLDAVVDCTFDMVVLPGGLPGANHLRDDSRIIELLQATAAAGQYTAAICAAPKVLAKAGLLNGRKATGYPGVLDALHIKGLNLSTDKIVQDGKVITSQGPGTAMDFALELITLLSGNDKRNEVEKGLRPTV